MNEYAGLTDDDKFGHDVAWDIRRSLGWRRWLRWTFGLGWKLVGAEPLEEPEPYGDVMLHWRDTWTGKRISTYVWNEKA